MSSSLPHLPCPCGLTIIFENSDDFFTKKKVTNLEAHVTRFNVIVSFDLLYYSLQSTLGWFAHPVYVDGDYPPIMKELVLQSSKVMGMEQSRLPTLSDDEKNLIKGK